jgi:hypothetical protein
LAAAVTFCGMLLPWCQGMRDLLALLSAPVRRNTAALDVWVAARRELWSSDGHLAVLCGGGFTAATLGSCVWLVQLLQSGSTPALNSGVTPCLRHPYGITCPVPSASARTCCLKMASTVPAAEGLAVGSWYGAGRGLIGGSAVFEQPSRCAAARASCNTRYLRYQVVAGGPVQAGKVQAGMAVCRCGAPAARRALA